MPRKKKPETPSIESVIRAWAKMPSASFKHKQLKEPDGMVHDFDGWAWWRVESTLLGLIRSRLITKGQRFNVEVWLRAFYVEGRESKCVLGARSFLTELKLSIGENPYAPRPQAQEWIPETKDKPTKRLPLKRGEA